MAHSFVQKFRKKLRRKFAALFTDARLCGFVGAKSSIESVRAHFLTAQSIARPADFILH